MADIFADIGAPKPKGGGKFVPALLTTSINAAGGLAAGRVDQGVSAIVGIPAAGTLLVTALCVGLRMMFASSSDRDATVRELAAGMAGWVGDDLFYFLKDLFLTKTWKPGVAYKLGDWVRKDGKVYQASKDIPASPREEPGSSRLWQQAAQGFRDADQLRSAAQALIADEGKWRQISDQVLDVIGPHMERSLGTEFTDAEKIGLRNRMRSTLADVVEREL